MFQDFQIFTKISYLITILIERESRFSNIDFLKIATEILRKFEFFFLVRNVLIFSYILLNSKFLYYLLHSIE